MKVAVIGAGAWGTTLAIVLHYNGHDVTLWEYKRSYAKQMQKKRENPTYLPGIGLPDGLLNIFQLCKYLLDAFARRPASIKLDGAACGNRARLIAAVNRAHIDRGCAENGMRAR